MQYLLHFLTHQTTVLLHVYHHIGSLIMIHLTWSADNQWLTCFSPLTGCYISRTTYLRPGEHGMENFCWPFHMVAYYRYLRFLSEGGHIKRVIVVTVFVETV